MVELHLLVVESEDKEGGASEVPASHQSRHCHQEKSEAGRVVLKVAVVDEDEGGQAEHGRHHLLPAEGHHLGGRQQQQEVGRQNRGSHEKPVLAALLSSA